MENLGLWPKVVDLARDLGEVEEIRMFAFWTMAAAAHHNPKVQEALLKHDVLLLAFVTLETDGEAMCIRQKSMLLISGKTYIFAYDT